MLTLTMTKGLPASGKSTWAKEQDAKRVNKDDLRAMIDNGEWSGSNEKLIIKARNELVLLFLRSGHSVIVDDTNLNPKMEDQLRELVQIVNDELEEDNWDDRVEFVVNDSFLSVDPEECKTRDTFRSHRVGDGVINRMMDDYERWYGDKLPIHK